MPGGLRTMEARQVVLVAAAAGAAMCAAYRLTDLVFDAVSKSRRQEVKESEEGEEAASRLSGEEVRKLSPVYDVKVGDRVVADVGHKRVVPGDVGRVVGLVTGKDSGEAGRARVAFDGDKGVYNYMRVLPESGVQWLGRRAGARARGGTWGTVPGTSALSTAPRRERKKE